jgi:hypothetical protein
MPYSSEAQRKFFHTNTAKAAGITDANVKEFDEASKGKALPEHVKAAEGGFFENIKKLVSTDKTDADNALDVEKPQPSVETSTDTAKMADGGKIQDEPGVQDATVSDFLAPYLLGPVAGRMTEGVAPALEGLGETGAAALGPEGESAATALEAAKRSTYQVSPAIKAAFAKAAPKMEEATEAGAPKITAYVKGIQKGAPGSKSVEIWGVKGEPEDLMKEFGDAAPGSVPEHVLRAKGILPEQVSIPQNAPNAYAEGGLAYPHVTFLENESPATVNKVTHVEHAPHTPATSTETGEKDNPKHMAKGGTAENAKLKAIYKAMGIKGYADGGPATNEVDPSQLPSGAPNPSDPGWLDWAKTALSQVGNKVGGLVPTMPSVAEGAANVAATPGIAQAVNAGLGTNLAGPPAVPAANAPAPTAPPEMPPALPRPIPPAAPATPAASTPGMPNLGTIFNQDTSKLTEGVNPEDRQALAGKLQEQQHGLGAIIAQAVSGLGDALAAKGGKEQHSLQNIFSMEKTQRDEALANFDKARQDRVQKLQLQTQMGDNALKQAAAADAYGTDEHLNSLIGAPKGTMKKDLPSYFQLSAAQVAKQEKNADLYMKATTQAMSDVDNGIKNAGIFNIKPTPAQIQASANKLRDQYYNRAQGNVLVKPSDGGPAQWIPAANIGKAKQMDPNLQIQP